MKTTTRLLSLLLILVLCLSVLPLGAAAAEATGWKKVMADWYYYENGSPVNGWKKISGRWYYFVPEWGGIMCTGWMNTDPKYYTEGVGPFTGDWYHFSSSGAMEYSKWLKQTLQDEDNNTYTIWYYILSSGKFAKGWQKIGGVWYYFDPEADGVMVSGGIYDIGGKLYYFKDSGAMKTGWQKIAATDENGDTQSYWAYFTSSGAMKMDGWQWDGSNWYYFQDGGYYAGGLAQIGRKYYFFKDSGAMYTGWKYLDDAWRYFGSSGCMTQEGQIYSGGKYYYIYNYGMIKNKWANNRYYGSDGAMLVNTSRTINGTYYTFDSRGVPDPWAEYETARSIYWMTYGG